MKFIHQYILAYSIVISYLIITVYLMKLSFSPTPMQDSTGSVFMLLGALSSALGMVMMYFFGSTRGSADKTSALMTMARGPHAEMCQSNGKDFDSDPQSQAPADRGP